MSDFTTLGLPEGANEDDIKYAYKQLAMKYHPDRGGDIDKFIDVKQAYERLMGKKGAVLEFIKVQVPCNKCSGSGNRVVRQGLGYFSEVCGRCRGTGKINKKVAK